MDKRRNLEILAALLALLTLLTACQPTPEAEPVIQKDTEKLIEMAVGVTDEQAGEQKVTLAERFGERFTVEYTTTTSGAKVTGDVKIRYLGDTGFPMYRMVNAIPEGEKVKELAKRLLGAEDVYVKTSFQSKADVKAQIDNMTRFLSDEEWMQEHREEEEDYDQWLSDFMQRIQDLQVKYNAMTGEEERPLLESWDGTYSTEPLASPMDSHNLNLVAHEDDFGDVPRVEIWYGEADEPLSLQFWRDVEEDFGYGIHVSEIPEDWDTPCGNAKITPREAANAAVALFDGILDVTATEVRWGGNGTDTSASTGNAYTVYLSTLYNGAAGMFTYLQNMPYNQTGDGYSFSEWTHERIEVVVNETGIRSCVWSGQMVVQDVLSEEVNLLDFDTIYHLFTQQMNRYLATEDAGTEIRLFGVTLGLMRIQEENSFETALLVPVWYFRGRDASEDFDDSVSSADLFPLCVLNAIDGSVIER